MYQTSVHSNNIGWNPGRFPGVSLKILHEDPQSGAALVLRKLEPKAVIPKHYHTEADETVYVLEGDFVEDGQTFGVGHVFFGKAGIPHGPHTTVNGSIVLTLFSSKLDVHLVD